MNNDQKIEARRRDYMRSLQELVERVGWAVQAVGAVDPGDVPYCYTVGLTNKGFPEVAIRGIDPRTGMHLINHFVGRLLKDPTIATQPRVSEIIEKYDIAVVPMSDQDISGNLFLADLYQRTFHQPSTVHVLQLIYPDRNGHFPGEPDCDLAVAHVQSWPSTQPSDTPSQPTNFH